MPSMYLALGYFCNHHCFFCPCGEKSELPVFAPKNQLLQAIESGIKHQQIDQITLSGGEPTLHPDFYELLHFCVNHGLRVTILSNGDSLSRMEYAKKLFDGIDRHAISVTTALHSDLGELHDKVTGSSGSYHRTIQGLLNLLEMGIGVTVKQVISRWNYQRLPEFVEFLYKTFKTKICITLCGMDLCGIQPESIPNVAVDYLTMQNKLEQALDVILSLRQQFHAFPQVTVADLPLCGVDPYYWGFFTKVSRGQLSLYSAPEGESGKVSQHSQIENDCNVYFNACKDCCVADSCPGVWYTAYQYFGETAVHTISPYTEDSVL